MEITEFKMEGVWFDLVMDIEGAHLYINPDDSAGSGNCMAAGITKKAGLIRVLDSAIEELQDLRFKVAYNSMEHVWDGLEEEQPKEE